jgi:peptidoglycan-associated lipoprotein
MKTVSIGICCAIMITFAGCSSKSAVSTGSIPAGSIEGKGTESSSEKTLNPVSESVVVSNQGSVVTRDLGAVSNDPAANTNQNTVVQESVMVRSPEVVTPAIVAGPVIGDIFFDFNSAALNSDAEEQLKQNAAWMQKYVTTSVTIEGHCDERGTDEYNIALGERRAIAAMDFLVTLGISGQRFSIVSYGEEQPFDQGKNEEGWSKNRRAHFVTK